MKVRDGFILRKRWEDKGISISSHIKLLYNLVVRKLKGVPPPLKTISRTKKLTGIIFNLQDVSLPKFSLFFYRSSFRGIFGRREAIYNQNMRFRKTQNSQKLLHISGWNFIFWEILVFYLLKKWFSGHKTLHSFRKMAIKFKIGKKFTKFR